MTESFGSLGKRLADGLGQGPEQERLTRQRAAVLAFADKERRPKSRAPLFAAAAVVPLAAAALVAALVLWPQEPEPEAQQAIVCTSSTGVVEQGQWMSAQDNSALSFGFSEGSLVTVQPGGRARLAHLEPGHVEISIESGTVSSVITPTFAVEWRFLAGPYRVVVVGTALEVSWSPNEQSLQVDVTQGRVRVYGAHISSDGIAVAQGQRLTGASGSVALGPLSEEPDVATEPDPSTHVTGKAAALQPTSREPDKATSPPRRSRWKALAESGQYAQALAEAEREGLDELIESLPPWQLLDLADTARLAGDSSKARRALVSLRSRFGGHAASGVAAFRLGRIAFDVDHNYAEASRWFRTVIAESGNGSLAGDARGRLMDALDRQGRSGEAAEVAERYLRHHPGGPYQRAAQALIDRESGD